MFPRASTFAATLLAAWIMTALLSAPVVAQVCTVSVQSMNFGSLKTQSLSSSNAVATLSASCTGLALLTVRLCPKTQTTDVPNISVPTVKASVELFHDAAHQIPLTHGLDIPLNALGSGSASMTIYGRLAQKTGPLRPGTYSTTISLSLDGTYSLLFPTCQAVANAAVLTPMASQAAQTKQGAVKR